VDAETERGVRKPQPRSFSRACAELAAAQHGVGSLEQLMALGMSDRGIQRRAREGALHRRYRGVYAIGRAELSVDGERLAAVLASGSGAALARRSAASFWEIRRSSAALIEVITPRRGRRPQTGIRLLTPRALPASDVTTCRGIPVTTVSRTLVDLAGVLDRHALERAVNEAEILRLLDVADVLRVMERAGAVRGAGRLRAALSSPETTLTRSELEKRFVAVCRRAGLPPPQTNRCISVGTALLEVDAVWPAERLVVELDGAAVHHTRRAFHEDRRRDAALVAAGYVVVRLTWQRVTRESDGVIRELQAILAHRRTAVAELAAETEHQVR
jgi:very-short-patch-repair endonuclease/predicted transcriptional regulator of viral defense system